AERGGVGGRASGASIWHSLCQQEDAMDVLTLPHVTHPGLLIAIGSAHAETRERVILRYFLEAAGGDDASVVVLATASETPETGERDADRFPDLGAARPQMLS